jgi:LmbE family N-acetylglucosaminyl deacetylase
LIDLPGGVLAVVSHPDDETFGCGGTLALHASMGADVRVLCLSCNPPERRREILGAAEELGVPEPVVLDDLAIAQTPGLIRRVADQVVAAKPRVVLTHVPFDYHREHRAAYEVVKEAVEWAAHTTTYDEPCQVERLLLMEVNTLIPSPHVLVDVSEHMEAKRRATKRYASQLAKFTWGYYERFNEKKAELRGVQGGCAYAEAFQEEPLAGNGPFYPVRSARSLL